MLLKYLELSFRKIIFVNDNNKHDIMEYNRLIDRKAETDRITEALKRENTQFIVVYGRRRIGKSTLIKYLVNS